MGWMGAVGAAAAQQQFDEVGEADPRPTELARATAPEGQGDEPSPAALALTEAQPMERATTSEAGEEQIVALQQQIRGVGRTVEHVWRGLLLSPILLWALLGFSKNGLVGAAMGGLLGVLFAGVLGAPLSAAYYGYWRRRLRRALASSPQCLPQVLLPLRKEDKRTRELAGALLRDLRVPTELTPADAPTGRGNEPAPSD